MHPPVLCLERVIALACILPETFKIDNLNVTTTVSNDFRLHERIGNYRHAVSPSTDHLSHEFLREGEPVAAVQVPNSQEPSCKSRLDGVQGVAGRRLLSLHVQDLPVTNHGFPQCQTPRCSAAHRVNSDDGGGASEHHDCLDQGDGLA